MDNKNIEISNNDKNKAEYDALVKENAVNKDDYYDRNNPLVKIVLLVLAFFIIVGLIIVFSITL